jgi:signal transduction histidine kinase/ActR/RegA family two-component response regulator
MRGTVGRYILNQLALAAVYFISAKFGLSLAYAAEAKQVSAVWPPTGIALAAILILGNRAWPGIALGALVVNKLTDASTTAALFISIGNTCEALLGAYLLRRFIRIDPAMQRIKDVIGLAIFGAAINTIVSSTVGITSLYLWGNAPFDRFHHPDSVPWTILVSAWQVWWIGDAMGALIVAPLLLTWSSRAPTYGKRFEAAMIFGLLSIAALIIYVAPFRQSVHFKFFIFPLTIWAAVRLGQKLTASAIVLVSAFAIWGALHNSQAFIGETLNERFLLMQAFMGVVSLTSLTLGAAIAERYSAVAALQNAEEALRKANDDLETRILARTQALTHEIAERKNAELKLFESSKDLQDSYTKLDERVRLRTADLEKANTELQIAKAALEAANRAKDEFLAVCSHELRTPLTPILGWTRILRSQPTSDPTVKRALEVIERNVKAQGKLIEDLLDISRIVAGKLRLNLREMDLIEVIHAAVETVKPSAAAKNITLEVKLETTDATTFGDSDRLQQVVWNLLSNAVKFTHVKGHVVLSLQCTENQYEITVSDDGEGMSAEFLPHVFSRFAQADSTTTRSHGGMGLGLAIVRHIVELHGGWVKAESAGKEKGSRFTVSLPIATQAQSGDSGPHYRTPLAGKEAVPYLQDMQVLVVDDEADTCEFVAAALEQWGARVATAPSAGEAIAALDRLKPDVLISDIGMPGEDGYALIRRVRSRDRSHGGGIPAIALTAFARAEDRARILSEGFQMHVPKPVDPMELAAAVSQVAHTEEKS